jgi:predicted cupin superfamily sugar epimerase
VAVAPGLVEEVRLGPAVEDGGQPQVLVPGFDFAAFAPADG